MSKIIAARPSSFAQLVTVAFVMLSASVSAQEPQQTAEGAMAFLSKTLVGSKYVSSFGGYSYHFTVKGFAPESKCSATFMIKGDNEDQTSKMEGSPILFKFDEVAEITSNTEYSTIIIKSLKNQAVTTFKLASSSISSRAAYAMEFLRKSCDPTAGTGF